MADTPTSPRYRELLEQTNAAARAGKLDQAGALAEEALAAGPEEPRLLLLAAYRRLQMNQPDFSIVMLERARMMAPADGDILNALGIALRRVRRLAEAREVLETATTLYPKSAPTHFNKGTVLEDMGDFSAARRAYEAAVAAQPNFADALARLSYLASIKGDHKEAAFFREQIASKSAEPSAAPGSGGRDQLLAIALARGEIEAGNFESALARLQAVVGSAQRETRFTINALIGDCHHGLGNAQAAFDHYVTAKSEQREVFAPILVRPGVEPFHDQVKRLTAFFSAQAAPWRGEPGVQAAPAVAGHVFLVGFPRSATTLVETALGAHPGIVTTEERETLDEAVKEFIQRVGGLERLTRASGADLDRYREIYWSKVRQASPSIDGKVVVDKLPLNAALLGLIAKLFPNARVLFALRDPRDAVFSCFRHVFEMNIAMFEFCTLEGTARLYDAVMQLAEVYRSKLDLPFQEIRYEDTVADFEGAMKKILGFLGLAFDESMMDFRERARSRPMTTPSAPQVARGLYDGAGQWKPYEAQMAPVLPILEPWVKRYGYGP